MKKLVVAFLLLFSMFAFGQATVAIEKQVDSLIQVSSNLTEQSNFDTALDISAAAEKLAYEKIGRESAGYGSACFNHGRVLHFKGDFVEAEKWYIEAIAIREKLLGKYHPDYISSMNNLGILYADMGDFEKAEIAYLEALFIREKNLGKKHPDYASSMNNLGNLYADMGNFEKAELFLLDGLHIREKALGNKHPDYASSLSNLSILYVEMGNYEKAEPLGLEAMAIREVTLGKNHSQYTSSLNNLAKLYYYLGNYKKAESLLLESKAIREKMLGKEHPKYASSLNNLALVYMDMVNFEKAEPMFVEAKAIWGKTLGEESSSFAQSLNNLGILFSNMGNYEKAAPFYHEALSIRKKTLGTEHPDYANSLENLAILYREMGHYEKAELLYGEVLSIRKKTLETEHPSYVNGLYNLAVLYMYLKNYGKAQPLFEEIASSNRQRMTKGLQHLSEKELNIYLKIFSKNQDIALSFTQMSGSKKLESIYFDNILFYKGFLLNSSNQMKRLALSDSTSFAKFNLLKSYQRRLAAQNVLPIVERDSANVVELEDQANTLEKELRRSLPGFDQALTQVSWQDVRQNLKPTEAAIEFVRFRYYNPDPTDSILYAALVLLPQDTSPHFVYLCTEAQLKTVLDRWDDMNLAESPAEVYWPKQGEAFLYSLLWQPLEALLPAGTAVWYSPAGLLHRLNLDAISKSKYESLADAYTLRRIGSTRQIALPSTATYTGKEAALFGGLRYESDTTAMQKSNSDLGIAYRTADTEERQPASPDGTRSVRDGDLAYLPNSLTEVQNISKNLKSTGYAPTVFTNFTGTEEAFLQIGKRSFKDGKPSPRILHLATHGYFFPDPKEDTTSLKSPLGMERNIPYRASDNPFIRSGLLLSGSEHAWRTGTPASPKLADGILTAADIAAMDLSNTELTVLSACETGLGDVESNEGVYGLQRAFKIAGTRYLIMSLWKVNDAATMELMTAFYAKWLDKKKPVSVPEAFRAAQSELRGKDRNPFFWAGFVLVE